MGTFQKSRGTVRFGAFEVDPQAGELLKQGAKIKLQEQPFQILQMLLEHPGEVVTREELQKKIWSTDTFVDFEQGLYNAIKRLREALGDSAENPQFIETLARRGYRFIGSLEAKPGSIESLAVLPLENMSRDPEQDYFAEGMTEALITSLAKIGALRVTSRTSAMRYKKTDKSLPQIARELNVDAVVEGTVQRSGDRVRISAQLVHALTDTHLWAESYDRDLRDILALQSDVAQAVARQVQVKLTPQEQAHFTRVHPVDPEAYEAYLRGRYEWNKRTEEGLRAAPQYFQKAISKDSTYAAAYAGLADCLSVLGAWGFLSADQSFCKAKSLALQALEIDSSLAEAHAALALASMYHHDFAAAEKGFERSIELNPRYATSHQWYGWFLGMMGRYEEGYTEAKRAIRLDPLSPVMNASFGMVYRFARRYNQAVEQYKKALELGPNFALAWIGLGFAYLYQAQHEPAIAAMQRAVELSPSSSFLLACLGEGYGVAGFMEEARKTLERLREISKQRYVAPYGVSRIHAALGQKDEALRWLETAYQERDAWMVMLKVDPRFDDMRSDPRFQDLLRRMNFPA